MDTLGFIGLGLMGSRMAANLQRAGYPLVVFDIAPTAGQALVEGGARRANDLREVAHAARILLLSLPGPAEVREVVTTLLPELPSDSVILDCSTSAPTLAVELANAAAQRGIHFLDAPVSGGVTGAEKGTLRIMVGATPEQFARVRPILEILGGEIVRAGGAGAGCAAKLVNNIYGFIRQAALIEGLLMAQANNVDLNAMLAVLKAAGAISPGLERKIRTQLFAHNFVPDFRIALATKDARLAVELAEAKQVPFDFGRLAYTLLQTANERGLGDQDVIAMGTLLEERAGFQLQG